MRPHWLRGWAWWSDIRDTGPPGDKRPLWQRLAVYVGIRREW